MITADKAALGELVRRRDIARKAIDLGQWTAQQAEQRLRPWAAIALRCGADVPPLRLALADEIARAKQSWSDFSTARIESVARALLADELARRDVWEPELLAARNKALDRLAETPPPTEADVEQAIARSTIAIFLGLPAWRPKSALEHHNERAAA